MTFTVTASTPNAAATTLNYQIAGSSVGTAVTAATAADFSTVTGTVTIAAGATTGTFTVTPTSDGVAEGFEGFKVSLFDSSFNTIATSGAVVISDGVSSGSTFTLTTGADSGPLFTGGSGADTINAVIGTDGLATNGTTINPGDNLNGGAGVDNLTISISGTNTTDSSQTLASFTTTDIEIININNYESRTTGTSSIDLAQANGVTTIALTGSSASGDTTFGNVKNLVAAKMQYGAGDLTLTYADAAIAGTADSQTLELTGVTGGTFSAQPTATGDVETVVINSLGSVRNVLTGIANTTNLKNITVLGDTAVTLGTIGAAVTKLDASANTSGVTATLASTATVTVTGSAGNDAFTATNPLTTGSVNAANGTDSLILKDTIANASSTNTGDTIINSSTLGAKYTGFETLNISQTDGGNATTVTAYIDRSQDVSLVSGITSIGLTTYALAGTANDDTDTATSVSFTNLSTAVKNLNISGLSYADGDAAGTNDSITVTVGATLASNTSNDSITVTLGTSTAAAGNNLAAATDALLLGVTLSNFETINLVSQGAANAINTLTSSELKTLTATGSKNLTVGLTSNTLTTSIDASAATGAFILTANGSTTASTILGGAGNDTLIGSTKADSIDGGTGLDSINGGDGNDTIKGGAGNDTINAGVGVDNVDGGDGDDQFNVTTITDFVGLAAAETVIGGAGNDTLTLNETATAITLVANDLLGLSSVDRIILNGTSGAGSITLTDAIYTANGVSNLKIIDGDLTDGTLTVNAGSLTGTNAVTVTANTTTAKNDTLTGGAGDDTFIFATTAGLEAADTVVGGAGTDTISLTATADVTAVLTGVRTVEKVVTTGNGGNVVITVGSDSVLAASTSLITDASSVSNGTNTLTYDGSSVSTSTKTQSVTGTAGNDSIEGGAGNDTIIGGDGADSITAGAGVDSVLGGNGDDIFVVATTGTGFVNLATPDTIDGGAGNDTLKIAAGTLSVNATDLLGLKGIEVIQIANTTQTSTVNLTDAVYSAIGATTLRIDATTGTSGAATVQASGLSATNSLTVDISATNNSAGNVVYLGAGNDTVKVDMQALNNTTTLEGGAGTDTLEIIANTGSGAITIDSTVKGFETILFSTAAGTYSGVVNDANLAAGITQTINGSSLTRL